MKLSYSRVELYNLCGQKFKYQYIDKLVPDQTNSPLLFGSACDKAFNYILEQKRDKKRISRKKAHKIFKDHMELWHTQEKNNTFVYFKADLPENINKDDYLAKDLEHLAWKNLVDVGGKFIDVYIDEILGQLGTIDAVQVEHRVENDDGDTLTLIIDFIATLPDGRKVVFDNKTASDVDDKYHDNSVKESKQLSLYTSYYPDHHSGYIALQKRLVDGKVKWKMVVDKIEESVTQSTFEYMEETGGKIKAGLFPKNEKACWSFGKLCPYYSICKHGSKKGLK
jgi:hypothetical protein